MYGNRVHSSTYALLLPPFVKKFCVLYSPPSGIADEADSSAPTIEVLVTLKRKNVAARPTQTYQLVNQ